MTALALFGCDGGKSSVTSTATAGGMEGGDSSTDTAQGQCGQEGAEIGLSDASVVGPTPQEVIDDTVGIYSGSMHWVRTDQVEFTGDEETTDVTIEIRYEGGATLDTDAEIPCQRAPCRCSDALAVDVVLAITTPDGLFDEQFQAQVVVLADELDPGSNGNRIEVRFDADDAAGAFSSDMLDVSGNQPDYVAFTLWPRGGAIEGGFSAGNENGSHAVGTIAGIGAVRQADGCHQFLYGGPTSSCVLAGCAEVVATSLFRDTCECDDEIEFCHPTADLEEEAQPSLYTRRVDERFGGYDDVLLIEGDPGGPWQRCEDAPEVEGCGCDVEALVCG